MSESVVDFESDSSLEEGEIQEFHSEFLNCSASSTKQPLQTENFYKNKIDNRVAMYEKNSKLMPKDADFINLTVKSHIVLSPKKNIYQENSAFLFDRNTDLKANKKTDYDVEKRRISLISAAFTKRKHKKRKKTKSAKQNSATSENIPKKSFKKSRADSAKSTSPIFQRKTEKRSDENNIRPAQSTKRSSKIRKNKKNTENVTISPSHKRSSSRSKSKKRKKKKKHRSAKSGIPSFSREIKCQTKMNSSVIEINDSVITIESDGEVEDGEVHDADVEIVENLTAKTKPATPPNIINNQPDSNEAEKPIFEIKFRSKDDFKSLNDRLLTALSSSFNKDEFVIKTDDNELLICAYTKATTSEPEDDSKLFLIDTAPTKKLNVASIPSYKRCNTDVLDEDTPNRKKLKAEEVNKCSRPKVQASCFNCGESDHSLRECTRPRNQARIQRARKKTIFRAERYHVDAEQRFAHIRPGKISTKTRHAMGFSRGEMPFLFYRMRVLGYPPAWLEEAKVQGSGMALFNADGTEVQGPHEEEGESESFKYDINKIFDFPGFNAHPGAKFYDDYQHHSVPPFQESQLKENFIKSLGENIIKGYKRKKLLDLPAPHDIEPTVENGTNCIEHDMELDDGELDKSLQPPLPFEADKTAPPPPPPPTEATARRSASPTLEDLREQQAQLLQQLESNTSLSTSTSENALELDSSKIETETTPQTPVKVVQLFNGPSIQGTPLLKFSEFEKLPLGDNFKVGVSDVINFENLPDSTGKYEQMKDLLKNVRVKMDKLQNSED